MHREECSPSTRSPAYAHALPPHHHQLPAYLPTDSYRHGSPISRTTTPAFSPVSLRFHLRGARCGGGGGASTYRTKGPPLALATQMGRKNKND